MRPMLIHGEAAAENQNMPGCIGATDEDELPRWPTAELQLKRGRYGGASGRAFDSQSSSTSDGRDIQIGAATEIHQ